jgi:hypothetical protein
MTSPMRGGVDREPLQIATVTRTSTDREPHESSAVRDRPVPMVWGRPTDVVE